MVKKILRLCDDIEADMENTAKVFMRDTSARNSLCGVGVLSKQVIFDLSAVGSVARRSGVDNDVRSHMDTYRSLGFNWSSTTRVTAGLGIWSEWKRSPSPWSLYTRP